MADILFLPCPFSSGIVDDGFSELCRRDAHLGAESAVEIAAVVESARVGHLDDSQLRAASEQLVGLVDPSFRDVGGRRLVHHFMHPAVQRASAHAQS